MKASSIPPVGDTYSATGEKEHDVILIVGGLASGKREYARSLGYIDAEIVADAQDLVRDEDADPVEISARLAEKDVVLVREVGSGVVPLQREERAWRDRVGALSRMLAERASTVVRVVCGVPQLLKGSLPSDSIELVIMRHGTTTANERRAYAGSSDVPLTEQGEREAVEAGVCDQVSIVYVSPLSRAKRTAELCFPRAEQIVVDDLREMDFGVFEGRSADDMEDDEEYRAWIEGMCEGRCPGGERRSELTERVARAVDYVVRDAMRRGLSHAVIVGHGGTVMAAMDAFTNSDRGYFEWHVGNCAGYRAIARIVEGSLVFESEMKFDSLDFLDGPLQASSSFFQNRACPHFPCHKGVREDEFNCLFCYCPLYALGPQCGGNYTYTDKGRKNCTTCALPHIRENGTRLVSARYEKLADLARNEYSLRESASIVNQLRWDPITELYRKEFFFRHAESILEAHPDQQFDMVCSDIRDFKSLNERYGREHCDRLLCDLASRLVATIPCVVASGRIEGDSFGFLIDHQESDWTSALGEVVESLDIGHIFVRFGIVEDVDHEQGAEALCNQALIALDQIRDSTEVACARYDDDLKKKLDSERAIIESMGDAIEEHQFLIYYQPKHDVNTGKVAGAEALVRWRHPELGLIQPSTFISVLERNDMISQLDRFVCEEVCREIARIRDCGLPAIPISINISPIDFDVRDMPEQVLEIADRYGVDHSLLHLELVETAFSEDPDNVASSLERLRSYGFKIELDDFGSGYSSLVLLNLLPLDILKIDGRMVRNAVHVDDFRIIRSAIQIAKLMNLTTVVEGVETFEVLNRLERMGCDLIQGYYFSWPMRQREFEGYLAESNM